MRTEQEIKQRFKNNVEKLLKYNNCLRWGELTKLYQRTVILYWVLGGEGGFPIEIYPERKVDEERLNLILKEG